MFICNQNTEAFTGFHFSVSTQEFARASSKQHKVSEVEVTEPTSDQNDTTETGYAEGWRPKAGDRVVGTVIDITATDGGYGIYPIVTLKTAAGEVAIHAFHTVLRRELARRRPVVGDDLDITYLGKQKGKTGTVGYDGYRVRSSKDTVGYDWSREGVEFNDPQDTSGGGGDIPIDTSPTETPFPPPEPAPAGEMFGETPPF